MGEIKPTNPKDLVGIKKVPLSTVPVGPIMEVGLAFLEGARKYGRHNYREMGVSATVYYDACLRHLMSWWEGEDIDPESGVSHLVKALACLFVLRDSILKGNWKDDRPLANLPDLNKLNEQAANIIEMYPDCAKPYLEKESNE